MPLISGRPGFHSGGSAFAQDPILKLKKSPNRREIHEGLQVIENWNSANDFILYGKGGEFASNRLEDQEILMLSLPCFR